MAEPAVHSTAYLATVGKVLGSSGWTQQARTLGRPDLDGKNSGSAVWAYGYNHADDWANGPVSQ